MPQKRPKNPISEKQAGPDFGSRVSSAEPVFKLVARSSTGRAILEKFLPLYSKGKVTIEPYPTSVVEKLRAVIPEDQPIGACFVTESNRGTIFLDFASPLGVLAPFLVHEMVHALEPRIWKGHARDSHRVRIETEASAFQTQFRFTQELRERDPAYDAFLKTRYPKAKILHQLLEFEDLEELYGRSA